MRERTEDGGIADEVNVAGEKKAYEDFGRLRPNSITEYSGCRDALKLR